MSKGYKRRIRQKRREKITVLIVGEGQTEEIYFKQLRQYERLSNVKIIVDRVKSPWETVRYIEEKYIKRSKDRNIFNYIFALVDADVALQDTKVKQKLENSRKQTARRKIQMIISIPCFELWFLLHFELYNKPTNNCDGVIKTLKKYIPEYSKAKETQQKIKFYSNYKSKLKEAVQHAKKLEILNTSQGDWPQTDVYKIMETINQITNFY